MIENRMVIDRAWPAPKAITREAQADELTRAAMFRSWDFVNALDGRDAKDILVDVIYACWRGERRPDDERFAALKGAIVGYIETWAENEAEREE